jgi:protein phosphatase 1L
MNKNLLFFLCTIIMSVSNASDRFSSSPTSYLDMCTLENERLENHDRRVFCRLPNGGLLFGVLDGHVTGEVSDSLARTFPGSFKRYLDVPSLSVKQAFTSALYDAEQDALKNLKGGSTALFVYTKDGIAHIAHVGDSRAVFGGKYGVAFATQDQTPDREDERKRIELAGGKITNKDIFRINGLAMSRAIGDRICKINDEGELNDQVIAKPEYTQLLLTNKNHLLIMATDGLWDAVGNDEAMNIVQHYYAHNRCLKGVASLLCDYAIDEGSKDNITVLVIDLLNQACKKRVYK